LSSETRSYQSFLQGIPNSYALVFFSNNRLFAWILIAVSFFDPISGLAGLTAIFTANLVAWLAGLNLDKISKGYYGFNSLLVGLGLGLFYSASPEFLIILIFSSLFTLFLSVALEGVIGKYHLPYLSIPFILGIWITIMATREFNYLEVSQRGVYMMNEMYVVGGPAMVRVFEWFNDTSLPRSVVIYFRSLGAILFQYHLAPGILIAIGLLFYSRIAFVLSLLGFYSAYAFYLFVGADMTTLSYSYIGFNFILTAIAIGGFFIIPSWYSFLWVLLLTPITSLLLTSFKIFFGPFQLSIYSLPFNIIVITFLYVLKFRERHFNKPELVSYQLFSPESNLYAHANSRVRFGNYPSFKSALPFWGEWTVTQAHDGKHTHKDQWQHAWDFEIGDSEGKTYRNSGHSLADYYCYDKPVLAPADGWIEAVIDHVEDNPVGQVNLEYNWGNTIVIRHTDHLFSALSHLKKGSIQVHAGAFVKKGDILAHCGSSGRSPVPHLHFQFQATPQPGSATIDIPLSHYMVKGNEGFTLESSGRPVEKEIVANIESDDLLRNAYNFVPGQELVFHNPASSELLHWEVGADLYNQTYIRCLKSGSRAFFRNEGDMIWFTHFEGKKDTLLFRFFLANFKVIFGFYRNLKLFDSYPLHLVSPWARVFQDIVAPFFIFTKASYVLSYTGSTGGMRTPEITLRSEAVIGKTLAGGSKFGFEMTFRGDRLERFRITEKDKEPQVWERVGNS
jgi:urea transporter